MVCVCVWWVNAVDLGLVSAHFWWLQAFLCYTFFGSLLWHFWYLILGAVAMCSNVLNYYCWLSDGGFRAPCINFVFFLLNWDQQNIQCDIGITAVSLWLCAQCGAFRRVWRRTGFSLISRKWMCTLFWKLEQTCPSDEKATIGSAIDRNTRSGGRRIACDDRHISLYFFAANKMCFIAVAMLYWLRRSRRWSIILPHGRGWTASGLAEMITILHAGKYGKNLRVRGSRVRGRS